MQTYSQMELPHDPTSHVFELAWEFLGREEEYQHERQALNGTPPDQWFIADKAVLANAQKENDIRTAMDIAEKYRRLDEVSKRRAGKEVKRFNYAKRILS